jgi:Xaa-Pro dipeptidase
LAPMPEAVRERLRDRLVQDGLDAIVCLSPEAFAYVGGFVVPSQPLMRWRQAGIVLSASGQVAFLCVDMEESTVRAADPDADLEVWSEFEGDAMVSLGRLLRRLGLDQGRLGIELSYLSVAHHRSLLAAVPSAELVAADHLLTEVRQRKTPEEVELLSLLSRIADTAIQGALGSIQVGSTELELAAGLTRHVFDSGGQQIRLMIVATGPRSRLPNVGPTSRTLEIGDVCRVEVFPVIDGYHAGVCRTAVVGKASAEAERVYRNLVECRLLVLEALRPGVSTRSVYETFRQKFDALGMPPIAFVGHGIGTDLHEEPYLAPFDNGRLEEGMVLGIEPLVYETGYGFGMQIKDMVVIEAGGARLLSDVADPTELFVIGA